MNSFTQQSTLEHQLMPEGPPTDHDLFCSFCTAKLIKIEKLCQEIANDVAVIKMVANEEDSDESLDEYDDQPGPSRKGKWEAWSPTKHGQS